MKRDIAFCVFCLFVVTYTLCLHHYLASSRSERFVLVPSTNFQDTGIWMTKLDRT